MFKFGRCFTAKETFLMWENSLQFCQFNLIFTSIFSENDPFRPSSSDLSNAAAPSVESLGFVVQALLFPAALTINCPPEGADAVKPHCQLTHLLTEGWQPTHRQLSRALHLLLFLSLHPHPSRLFICVFLSFPSFFSTLLLPPLTYYLTLLPFSSLWFLSLYFSFIVLPLQKL